jgi:hypothetical protein
MRGNRRVTTGQSVARTASVLALLAVLVLPTAPVARAQNGGGDSAKAQELMKMRADRMAQELGLTPDQSTQLTKINADAVGKMKALQANPPSDKKARAKQMKSILGDREAALKKLMSADQFKKYKTINQEDTAMMQTESMAHSLKLTDEQVEQVDKINLEAIQKMSSAKNERNKIKMARALRSAQDKKDGELKKVLTPEQWQTYEAMKEEDEKGSSGKK